MKLVRNVVFVFVAFIVICYGLIWLLSPWLVRTMAAKSLSEFNVVLDANSKVRLNLFNSSLTINDVTLHQNDLKPYNLTELQVRYSPWRLLKKEVVIDRIHLRDMTVQVSKRAEQIIIGGVDLSAGSDKPKDDEAPPGESTLVDALSFLAPHVLLEDIRVNIDNEGNEHSVFIRKLDLKGTRYSDKKLATVLELDALLDKSKIALTANLTAKPDDAAASLELNISKFNPAVYQYLLPQPISRLQAGVDIALNMELVLQSQRLLINSGSLTLAVDQFQLQQENLQSAVGRFELTVPQIKAEANLDGTDVSVAAGVTLGVGQLDVKQQGFQSALGRLDLAMPSFRVAINADGTAASAAVETPISLGLGQLQLQRLELENTAYEGALEGVKLRLAEFTAEANLDGTDLVAQAKVALELTAARLGLAQSETTLASLGRMETSEIEFNLKGQDYKAEGDTLSLQELVVSKVTNQLPALLAMQSIKLDNLELTPDLISVNAIAIGAGQVHVDLDKSGTLLTLVDTAALGGQPAPVDPAAESSTKKKLEKQPAPAVSADPEPGPTIQLAQLSLREPFNISIDDKSNSQTFAKTFVITQVQVGEIDSAQPNKKTDFSVTLKDQEYFNAQLTGWLTPFSEKMNSDAEITLREFALHEVAPYLKDSLGFEVKAGQLDLDFKGRVKDDELTSKSTIFMRGTQFGASEKVDEANLIGQSAIPLNVALNMLKDGDGNIELKVPINGDINDPSFGVQNVLGLVIKKIAMSQAKKQLLTMFVPYAQVVSVAISAGSYALKVRFEDLPYAAGQVEVEDAQQPFVQQMAALMQDKKDVQVRVCAVATALDLGASFAEPMSTEQRAQLLDLAQKRAQAFKATLVKSSEINSSRLLICSPSVDKKTTAVPRIEFGT